MFRVKVTLTPPTGSGWQLASSSANDADGVTTWTFSATDSSSTAHVWIGTGKRGQDGWSDVLFTGTLTQAGTGNGTPPPFDASVADISIYVDALSAHTDGFTGHWPPVRTSKEHFAETSQNGGLYLPPSLTGTNNTFPSQLDTSTSYKTLALYLEPQWVPSTPTTVGTATFTLAGTGLALYRVSSGSLICTSGGSGAIAVPAAGFSNEKFAILTNDYFTAPGSITAIFTWDPSLVGGPPTAQDFVRLVPLDVVIRVTYTPLGTPQPAQPTGPACDLVELTSTVPPQIYWATAWAKMSGLPAAPVTVVLTNPANPPNPQQLGFAASRTAIQHRHKR